MSRMLRRRSVIPLADSNLANCFAATSVAASRAAISSHKLGISSSVGRPLARTCTHSYLREKLGIRMFPPGISFSVDHHLHSHSLTIGFRSSSWHLVICSLAHNLHMFSTLWEVRWPLCPRLNLHDWCAGVRHGGADTYEQRRGR